MAKLGVRPGERSRQSTGVTKWIVEDTKVGRKYHFTDPTRAKQLAKTLEVDHPGWIVLKRV